MSDLRWLDQVEADPAISAAGFRIAFAILRLCRGSAVVTQAELAARTRLTVRGVRNLIGDLAAAGHLAVTSDAGWASDYRPVIKPRNADAGVVPAVEAVAAALADTGPRHADAGVVTNCNV
jgi:hypothetical protein